MTDLRARAKELAEEIGSQHFGYYDQPYVLVDSDVDAILAAFEAIRAEERQYWFDTLLADARGFADSPLSDEVERRAMALLAHCVLDKMKPGWRTAIRQAGEKKG